MILPNKQVLNSIYTVFKWVLLVAACIYLVYKLVFFDGYDDLIDWWDAISWSNFIWLTLVFVLFPCNWMLEALKWKMLTEKIQKLSFYQSIKAVLAGIATGFFTPNRIGEMIGRIIFLEKTHKAAGVTLSLVNSLTQNIIIVLCGIPAISLFFLKNRFEDGGWNGLNWFIVILLVCLVVFFLIYLCLPAFTRRFSKTNIAHRLHSFLNCLSFYSTGDLLKILFVSLIRYLVFSLQFFFLLRFFNVGLQPLEAIVAIPANYLFVTFTPAFAFSELPIRGSYAVFFIGTYSAQTANIALAGMGIWLINFMIPVLIGAIIMLRDVKQNRKR